MSSENPVASVTIGPVLVNGLPCRLIELADGSGRVQSSVEGHWVTGGASVSELMVGTPCADPETGVAPGNTPCRLGAATVSATAATNVIASSVVMIPKLSRSRTEIYSSIAWL